MKVTKKKGEIPYLERDISWMYFNRRILSEAEKAPVPLLERLSFLGIYSNNLDEFYRVRVATLNRIIEYEDKTIKAERETAIQTFREISRLNALYTQKFEETFTAINTALRQNRIYLLNEQELQEEQADYIREFYKTQLIGSTTPLFTSSFRHFSDQPDDHIYLSVCLQTTGKTKKDFAIIALPVQSYGRFIRIPGDNDRICLMFLDDIVRFCLPLIFNGRPYDHFEAYTFKFTKDAEMELDSDLRNSIMQKISKGVKSRKNGEPIRLVYDSRMPAVMQRHLSRMLCMDRWDTQVGAGRYQNLKDLMKFPDCKRDDLKYPPSASIVQNGLFRGRQHLEYHPYPRSLPALSLSQFFFFLACTPGSHDRPERQSYKNDPLPGSEKFQGYPNFNRSSQKREKSNCSYRTTRPFRRSIEYQLV